MCWYTCWLHRVAWHERPARDGLSRRGESQPDRDLVACSVGISIYGRYDESHSVSLLVCSHLCVFAAQCAATSGATAPELACPAVLDAAASRNRASAQR